MPYLNKILNIIAYILFAISIYLSILDKYIMLSNLFIVIAIALILYVQGKQNDKL
jgi:preprotein translocase subunit SecG